MTFTVPFGFLTKAVADTFEIDYMEYGNDSLAQGSWVGSDVSSLQSYSESTIKTQGSYALKLEATTDALNESVTKSLAPTGGTITTSGNYTIHTFTSSGTFTPASGFDVEYLVVAGGGGGASNQGGGGGAGGYRTNGAYDHAVTAQAYAITVGAGGASGASSANGVNGTASVFDTISAAGGGYGGYYSNNGGSGGSGGGGGGTYTGSQNAGGAGDTPDTTPDQGFAGGSGNPTPSVSATQGGGGGGASEVGTAAYLLLGGAGGDGVASSITGSSVTYAGGGGGSAISGGTPGTGGSGGGGAGGLVNTPGVGGTANTGGGGGGSSNNVGVNAGGSGIVIIRYLTSDFTGNFLDLTDKNTIKFDARSTGTGSNLQASVHDSGGTTSTFTIPISTADTYESQEWDISGIANADKDAIDQIQFKVLNASSARDYYIDNMIA